MHTITHVYVFVTICLHFYWVSAMKYVLVWDAIEHCVGSVFLCWWHVMYCILYRRECQTWYFDEHASGHQMLFLWQTLHLAPMPFNLNVPIEYCVSLITIPMHHFCTPAATVEYQVNRGLTAHLQLLNGRPMMDWFLWLMHPSICMGSADRVACHSVIMVGQSSVLVRHWANTGLKMV